MKVKAVNTAITAIALIYSAQGSAQETLVLEETIVTAQKTEESLQDAAIAINAASGDRMEQLGIADATALGKVAPSLVVSNGGGANTAFFVRGVGNFTNNGYTNPAVGFNIDGVYIGRPSSTISSFLDLNRVEVLKGPQGTLYGRNSTGGAINVISNSPVLGENNGSIKIGAGNHSAYDVTGVANFALSDTAAMRVAGVVSERDGYFDDGTSDAENVALRAGIYMEPSDTFSMRVSADYSTQQGAGSGVRVNGRYAFRAFNSSLPVPNWEFIPLPDSVGDDFSGLHNPATLDYIRDNVAGATAHVPFEGFVYPSRDDSYWGVNAELNFELGWADLTVIPAYRISELDNQFNGPPFKAALNQDDAEQTSFEARLAGTSGILEWILGAYYFDETVEGTNSFNQFSNSNSNDWKSEVDSASLFARGTFSVTDELRLVAGIRYTDDGREMNATNDGLRIICLEESEGRPPDCSHLGTTVPVALTASEALTQIDPALFPTGSPLNADGSITPGGRPFGPINVFAPDQFGPGAIFTVSRLDFAEEDGDEETTYRAAIEFDLTPEHLLYASFESGFRSGGFNLSVGREFYKPEFIDSYTIGSKNRFMDDRLEVNAEIFYWKYEDQQLAALGLDSLGNPAFYTRNVGASTIQGLDLDFQFAAAENTLVRGSLQYLDATYDEYSFDQVDISDAGIDPPNFLTPINGCTNTLGIYDADGNLGPYDPALDVVGATRGFDVDCSGKDALNAPEIVATLGIQQTFNLENLTLIVNLDGRYRDERELGFNYLPVGRSDTNLTGDASLTLISEDGRWKVNAFVRNFTDEVIAATYQLGSGNVSGSAMEPPRTYGVNFSYNFGD